MGGSGEAGTVDDAAAEGTEVTGAVLAPIFACEESARSAGGGGGGGPTP